MAKNWNNRQDQVISWFNSNKRTLTEINSKKPYKYQRLLINKRMGIKKNYLFHTYWVILFESTWVKTWFTPLYNQSEKRNGFFTCEYNGSTNHSAPTKSNRVFGSFVFSLKVLFWQLCQKVKTFRFLVWIISQENCQKKLNNGWRRNPSLSRFAEIR